MTDALTAIQTLKARASKVPWFLEGLDLHDAGTWLIATMAREGNPSTKSDPKATARLAVLAVNRIEELVAALGERSAMRHELACTPNWQTCESVPCRRDRMLLAAIAEDCAKALGEVTE